MSRKYISQVDNQNFVFPNNTVSEYDVEIIHDINDNCVSGSTSNFSVTGVTTTGMTINFDYIWDLNGATPYIRNSDAVAVLSLHMMGPTQNYYKPFLTVGRLVFVDIPITRIESGVTPGFDRLSFVVTPAMLGLTTFTTGTYYFEIKFIGERCVFPVCFSQSISVTPPPTATPTATPTLTPTPTATPTLTPTVTPPTYYYYSIKKYDCNNDCAYVSPDLVGRSVNVLSTVDGMYRRIGSFVYQVQSVITPDPMSFDIDLDTATATNLDCTLACDAPVPTATPTPTSTSTPTPTPTATSTPTPTPSATPSGVTSFGDCGYGSSVSAACNDAGINARTLYSDCDGGSFGVGCFVYVDTFPNPLTGYTNVFMNGACWDINSSTGVVTAFSSVQC